MPERVVLDKRPKQYLKQGLSYCGGFSAKAILEAYGKDAPDDPRELYPNTLGRLGICSWPSIWQRVFRERGLAAISGDTVHNTDKERLSFLKLFLAEGSPVMLRIGNGYLPSGNYSKLVATLVGHWVTLWGYDDPAENFYVYDSCVPEKKRDLSLPIGNVARSYRDVLRDWRGGYGAMWPYAYVYAKNS